MKSLPSIRLPKQHRLPPLWSSKNESPKPGKSTVKIDRVDGSEIRLTSWYVLYPIYPIIYRVSNIPGGCLGFLPSTVGYQQLYQEAYMSSAIRNGVQLRACKETSHNLTHKTSMFDESNKLNILPKPTNMSHKPTTMSSVELEVFR